VGGLLGLTARHPFERLGAFAELKGLSPATQAARLADPTLRSNLLAQAHAKGIAHSSLIDYQRMFPLQDPPNYEPDASDSIQAMADRAGQPPLAVMLDVMRQNQGKQLLLLGLFNYTDGNLDAAKAMLEHPCSVIGLSDGGAHCGAISDGSTPTFMLTHWARDRKRGLLPLEFVVKKQTSDTARLYGLNDRGVLAPGYRADINVIDHAELALEPPEMVHDLPAGGGRFVQKARGYRATLVSGEVVTQDGEDTGARPGRLIRGSQTL
jgi:N-acyl-D-aspartate/D-glutamate deacylase